MADSCRSPSSSLKIIHWHAKKVREFDNYYSDFDEVLSGNRDDIPKAFFYIVEGLTDVKEKAASLAEATAK